MPEPQIQSVDPNDCHAPDDADPTTREEFDDLLADIMERQQLMPIMLCPHPDRLAPYLILDGVARVAVAKRLKREVKAIIHPKALSPAEQIEAKFAMTVLRRVMTPLEMGIEGFRYMEVTGCTQQQAAVRLKCSSTKLFRGLSLFRIIPADCRALACQAGPFVISLVTPLKDAEAIRKALAFACKAGPDGKKPPRAELSRFVDQLRGKKPPKPAKAKRLKLRIDDRRIEIVVKADDTAETLIEAFKAAVARLQRHKELPLHAVAVVLGDIEPAATVPT